MLAGLDRDGVHIPMPANDRQPVREFTSVSSTSGAPFRRRRCASVVLSCAWKSSKALFRFHFTIDFLS